MPISARGILATIAASAGQNGKFSKVGTVFVYLLSNFRFDSNLLIVVRERPINLQGGGGVMFFFLKKYSDSQCC